MTLIRKSVFRRCAATAIFSACLPMPASAFWEGPLNDAISISGPKHWDCTAMKGTEKIVSHPVRATSRDRAEAIMRSLTNLSNVYCN